MKRGSRADVKHSLVIGEHAGHQYCWKDHSWYRVTRPDDTVMDIEVCEKNSKDVDKVKRLWQIANMTYRREGLWSERKEGRKQSGAVTTKWSHLFSNAREASQAGQEPGSQ